jgi:hypothetical protein
MTLASTEGIGLAMAKSPTRDEVLLRMLKKPPRPHKPQGKTEPRQSQSKIRQGKAIVGRAALSTGKALPAPKRKPKAKK